MNVQKMKHFIKKKNSIFGYSLRDHQNGHPTKFEPITQKMWENICLSSAITFWMIMIPIMITKYMTI